MDFLSLHEKVTEHNNFSHFLLNKFEYKEIDLGKRATYSVESNEFIIIMGGLLVKENCNRISKIRQYSFDLEGDFIFNLEDDETCYLDNIKDCRIAVLDKNIIFDMLEKDGLLVHLFLEKYLKAEEDMDFLKLHFLNSNKRIIHSMLQISRLNQQAFKLPHLIFPKEIKLTNLAKYCNCNRVTVSRLLSKLKNENYIFVEEEGLMIPEESISDLLDM
ncbi:Crp/Fnr family transcriptional regulator [Listeria aquatica]|uniref:Crp/Fnr family transcriptional regulator n=1 Tax=Listeria aquatica TaxID=1494960 RepID=A0A841ZN29_9LIST|nr:Crp/Fnr family transcriptional regulator [Listeria aquatica]MBC1521756.1 Crp/Fnr family transcriptional regulator [Listeria aquatica]